MRNAMHNSGFQARLVELTEQVPDLPESVRQSLAGLVVETELRHRRLRIASIELEEAVASLRLNSRYLAFDLAATKRENRALRRALQER